MKARRLARRQTIHPYVLGDILLEADVAASRGPVLLPVLGDPGGTPMPKATNVVDIVKPKPEDYPALLKTLQVLKFSDDNVIAYHEALGSLINLASGMIWGVGAVLSVASFIEAANSLTRSRTILIPLSSLALRDRVFFLHSSPKSSRAMHSAAVVLPTPAGPAKSM